VAVRRSMVRVPDIKPEALDAAWRRAVNESLGGLFRKPDFLDNYSPAIEQYGVPADADTCSSFAGPPGMSNVLGDKLRTRQWWYHSFRLLDRCNSANGRA
jgi:hypothetical protein